jgi:hypothetical protein
MPNGGSWRCLPGSYQWYDNRHRPSIEIMTLTIQASSVKYNQTCRLCLSYLF